MGPIPRLPTAPAPRGLPRPTPCSCLPLIMLDDLRVNSETPRLLLPPPLLLLRRFPYLVIDAGQGSGTASSLKQHALKKGPTKKKRFETNRHETTRNVYETKRNVFETKRSETTRNETASSPALLSFPNIFSLLRGRDVQGKIKEKKKSD